MSDSSETGILQAAWDWRSEGKQVALATVVQTWGSSPRQPGSRLAVREDGFFVGSVSGGCVEAAVVQEALQVMRDGQSKMLEFGVSHERAWEVGLACGGKVQIFVEPVQ
jgi:xanthine/CO dehydrogenase XdhC/CoxF family maturation factor